MPEFDNLILSHADRTRIIAKGYRKAIASKNGMVPATVLVDGFVCGTWKTELTRDGKAELVIEPFETLAKKERDCGCRRRAARPLRGGAGRRCGFRGPVRRVNLDSSLTPPL